MQFRPHGRGKLLWIPVRPHDKERGTRRRLHGWQKHRWLLILSNVLIFSVFDHADHLNAPSVHQLVEAANRMIYRAKHLAGEISVYHGDGWRVFAVMPVEGPARQQAGAGCAEI